MELAASWKPLMKSNTNAVKKIRAMYGFCRIWSRSVKNADIQVSSRSGCSAHLDDDALEHIGHVFQTVGDLFHCLVNVLPLDDLDGVFLLREQFGQRRMENVIRGILDLMDGNAIAHDLLVVLGRIHPVNRFRELLAAADNLLGEIDRVLGGFLNAEEGHAVGGRIG